METYQKDVMETARDGKAERTLTLGERLETTKDNLRLCHALLDQLHDRIEHRPRTVRGMEGKGLEGDAPKTPLIPLAVSLSTVAHDLRTRLENLLNSL